MRNLFFKFPMTNLWNFYKIYLQKKKKLKISLDQGLRWNLGVFPDNNLINPKSKCKETNLVKTYSKKIKKIYSEWIIFLRKKWLNFRHLLNKSIQIWNPKTIMGLWRRVKKWYCPMLPIVYILVLFLITDH